MMATYRLPDGVEVASLDVNAGASADKAWVTHPMLGSILIDRDKLTEVPPEPEEGFVGRFGADIWQRDDRPETDGAFDEVTNGLPADCGQETNTGILEPCQPIGCDNGHHLAGCVFAAVDGAEAVSTDV